MGLNEADKAKFATVLKNVKYDCLASLASTVRHSGHHSTDIINVAANPRPISCRYLSNINCGSYHVVINVLFADGTMRVLKIPGTGHKEGWDTSSAQSLVSEAQTMRLIRRETSVTVPAVHAFDAPIDNELGCLYILMEMIHGKPLYEVWFDEDVSQNKLEEYRARALQGIAGAMSQLNRLTFSEGGGLLFNDKGNFTGVGSSKVVDLEVLYEKLQSEDKATPFYQRKPFKDPKSYFQAMLDRRGKKMERSEFDKGVYDLLHLFIDWSLPDSSTFHGKSFVLSHPDFDTQNILATSDGTLAGIVDWDWVSAVPSCIRCQKYPLFSIKDYDPVDYDYDVKAGKLYDGYDANSPTELSCYRAMYAQFMEACLTKDERANMDKDPRRAARVRKARKEAANITRRSLVFGILELAASAPHLTTRMMTNMFEELGRLTAAEWDTDSSTTSDDGCGSDDVEGDGNADTEPSEVDDTSLVAERNEDADIKVSEMDGSNSVEDQVCINDLQSGRDPEKIETFSIDDLVNEIEKLTALSPHNLDLDSKADQTCSHITRLIETEKTHSEPDSQDSNSGVDTADSRKPRLARVCGWAQKKLRHRAEKLHRKDGPKVLRDPRKPKLARAYGFAQKKLRLGAERLHHEKKAEVASENLAHALDKEGPSGSRKPKATRALCGWTETQLSRVIDILHCNKGLVGEGDIELKVDAVRKGGLKELVEWLQRKLKQLLQILRLKTKAGVDNASGSEGQTTHGSSTLALPREITKEKKREICCQVAHMAQNNKMPLTFEHHLAIARWMIRTLQEGPCPAIPSQKVDHATEILPIDNEINTSDESFDVNGGGASRSETFVDSEVSGTELCAVISDATEELHPQGIAEAGATKQDAKAIGRRTLLSNDGRVDVRLGLEGKAGGRDEGGKEYEEDGHDEILADGFESRKPIQIPATDSPATNEEKPDMTEKPQIMNACILTVRTQASKMTEVSLCRVSV